MMSSSTISTDSKPDAGFWRRERSQGTTSSGTSFDARASFEAHKSVVVASREVVEVSARLSSSTLSARRHSVPVLLAASTANLS